LHISAREIGNSKFVSPDGFEASFAASALPPFTRRKVRIYRAPIPPQEISPMLPANTLAEITTNLAALNLQPNAAAQILAAVLAPLLRNSSLDPEPERPRKRAGWPRGRPPRASRRRKKTRARRRASRPTEARERAIAAIRDNPDATLATITKLAKCGYRTAVNARKDLAAEERKATRKPREASPKRDRRERAQQFLKGELARGPKKVSDVEEAAGKAHIDVQLLEQARADLGIVTSRANIPLQWSLPG
jgi:hypothetical protein